MWWQGFVESQEKRVPELSDWTGGKGCLELGWKSMIKRAAVWNIVHAIHFDQNIASRTGQDSFRLGIQWRAKVITSHAGKMIQNLLKKWYH